MVATPAPSSGTADRGVASPSMVKMTVPVGTGPPAPRTDTTDAVMVTGSPTSDGLGAVVTVVVDSIRSTR